MAQDLAAEGAVLTGYDACVPAHGPEQARQNTSLTAGTERPAVIDSCNLLDPEGLDGSIHAYIGLGTSGTSAACQGDVVPAARGISR